MRERRFYNNQFTIQLIYDIEKPSDVLSKKQEAVQKKESREQEAGVGFGSSEFIDVGLRLRINDDKSILDLHSLDTP